MDTTPEPQQAATEWLAFLRQGWQRKHRRLSIGLISVVTLDLCIAILARIAKEVEGPGSVLGAIDLIHQPILMLLGLICILTGIMVVSLESGQLKYTPELLSAISSVDAKVALHSQARSIAYKWLPLLMFLPLMAVFISSVGTSRWTGAFYFVVQAFLFAGLVVLVAEFMAYQILTTRLGISSRFGAAFLVLALAWFVTGALMKLFGVYVDTLPRGDFKNAMLQLPWIVLPALALACAYGFHLLAKRFPAHKFLATTIQ